MREFRRWAGLLVMVNDDNSGVVSLAEDGSEQFSADFQPRERERIDGAFAFSRDVLEAAGATRVLWTGLLTTHVQGTCRMGSDPERSVVDADCQSWDVKRLYVGDGSLIPRTLSVNPSLTIWRSPTGSPSISTATRAVTSAAPREGTRVRAALLREYHQPLELIERPAPEPERAGDVLVRIGGAGVCEPTSMRSTVLMEPAGVTLPRVLGHESAGWVEAVGDGVSTVAPGDAVIVYPPYSCGLCVACRRGDDMHCTQHAFTGLSRDGGFAEFVVVSERSVIALPAGVEPVNVALHADAGLTAYHVVRRLAPLLLPGTWVAVIGVGGVGHIALQLVRELGSSNVLALDTDERRRRLASELGAKEVFDGGAVDAVREATDGRGANVVLDFVGTDSTHTDGLAMLGRHGTYSVVGYGGMISVPSVALVVDEKSVVGNLVGSWIDLWELMQLHARGRIELRTQAHPLEEINDVLAQLRDGEVTGRAVIVP